MNTSVIFRYAAVILLALRCSTQAASGDPILYPGPEQIPEWAEQGRFRFARLDGGPIEILKTARSSWGMHFTARQKEVLGNLYSTYSGRMLELLSEANLNWVWITWSVGYSDPEEAVQREQCRRLVEKLHGRGIRVAAYVCAVSMFWESMFRDEPRSVRWVLFDPQGVPYRYSGGRDPLRFIADIRNQEWLEHQKRRIGAAIDAGVDAVFLDNTSSQAWGDNAAMDHFIGNLRRFIRQEKRSGIPLLTNYGLVPDRIVLNRNMEVIFNEYWMEPGVWGDEWDVSNIRRMKYVRGVAGEWKPMISEYSRFHTGSRATGWLKPKSKKLGIAEAAAFQSAYAWDMEGPFDAALIDGDPAALESWKAIGHYNGFLKNNEDIYAGARSAAPLAALISAKPRRGSPVSFGWDRDDSGVYDLLAKNSLLFDIRLASLLDEKQLAAYAGVVVPDTVNLTAEERSMLERYERAGGRVYFHDSAAPPEDLLAGVRRLAEGRLSLSISGAPHVAGNATRLGSGRGLAIHLLNYAPAPAAGVRVRLDLGAQYRSLAGGRIDLRTPDPETGPVASLSCTGAVIEFSLKSLDTYAVVIVSPPAPKTAFAAGIRRD